jgi:hypothetical protein
MKLKLLKLGGIAKHARCIRNRELSIVMIVTCVLRSMIIIVLGPVSVLGKEILYGFIVF